MSTNENNLESTKLKLLQYQNKYNMSSVKVYNYYKQSEKPPINIPHENLTEWVNMFEEYIKSGVNIKKLR